MSVNVRLSVKARQSKHESQSTRVKARQSKHESQRKRAKARESTHESQSTSAKARLSELHRSDPYASPASGAAPSLSQGAVNHSGAVSDTNRRYVSAERLYGRDSQREPPSRQA